MTGCWLVEDLGLKSWPKRMEISTGQRRTFAMGMEARNFDVSNPGAHAPAEVRGAGRDDVRTSACH